MTRLRSKALYFPISAVRVAVRSYGLIGTLKRIWSTASEAVRPSSIALRMRQQQFDRSFGVNTAGVIPLCALDIANPEWRDGVAYEATAPELFESVISSLPIRFDEYAFIDLGSGKGRALLLASRFAFDSIVGVEISEQLNEIANQNIKATGIRATSTCMSASQFDFPDKPTVAYMFNPFNASVLEKVLANIAKSLNEYPRPFFIVYRTPKFRAMLDRCKHFEYVNSKQNYLIYRNRDCISNAKSHSRAV
jgi:SAM-dependent methyltransferase